MQELLKIIGSTENERFGTVLNNIQSQPKSYNK